MDAIEVLCSECSKAFDVAFNDGAPHDADLDVELDPDGGLYAITVICPHCQHIYTLY